MSYYDGLCPSYTFRLSIEREDRQMLDVAITAKGKAAELNRAKKTIQRLLNENTPKIEPGPIPAPDIPAPVIQAEEPEDPAPEQVGVRHAVKGVVKLRCPECEKMFHTCLKDYQEHITCNCGRVIDLTDSTMARFEYDCPKCGKHNYGKTNLEDPEIEDNCVCGEIVRLKWDKQSKKYTIKNAARRDNQ